MKLRILLFLLAGGMVYLIVQLLAHDAGLTPRGLLRDARAHLAEDPPDYDLAFRKVERGIDLAHRDGADVLQADLALERVRIFRHRWDLSLDDRSVVHDDADLERVLAEGIAYVDAFGDERPEALRLIVDAALDLKRPDFALELLERLERATRGEVDLDAIRARAHAQRAEAILFAARDELDRDSTLR